MKGEAMKQKCVLFARCLMVSMLVVAGDLLGAPSSVHAGSNGQQVRIWGYDGRYPFTKLVVRGKNQSGLDATWTWSGQSFLEVTWGWWWIGNVSVEATYADGTTRTCPLYVPKMQDPAMVTDQQAVNCSGS